jgi:Tol biopolymer transport system component
VTHVQFDPTGSGRIIFNCEGVRLDNRPRTWCLETDGSYRPLYDQPENESDNHENFSADGSTIIYHGTRDGVPLIAGRRWDGSLVFETSLAGAEIHHVTPTPSKSTADLGLVTDGGENVTLYRLANNRIESKTVLCQHLSRQDPSSNQDDHPHPLTIPNGKSVIFSSNRDGTSNIYEVPCMKRRVSL